MMSFNGLPQHVKHLVFARLSNEDRFETGRVCTEWFELTLETYRPLLKDNDHLLKDLLVVFNHQTKKELCSWHDLLRFCKIDTAVFSSFTSKFVVALKKYQPGIGSFFVWTMDSALTYSDLRSFSKLQSIQIANVGSKPFPSNIFPKSVKKISLKRVGWKTIMPLSYYAEEANNIESLSLRLENQSSTLHPEFVLHNILKLTLQIPENSASHEVALSAIRNCSSLQDVTVIGGWISQSCFRLFGSNVKKVCLLKSKVDPSLKLQLGHHFDRSLLFFLCEQWQSLELFRLHHFVGSPPCNEQRYLCIAVRRVECIHVPQAFGLNIQSVFLPNEWNCRKLRIDNMQLPNNCKDLIPATVEDLSIGFEDLAKGRFLPEDLLCDPSKLKHLALRRQGSKLASVVELGSLQGMVSLTTLYIDGASETCITTILTGCTSLEKLTIRPAHSRVFEKVASDVVSQSVKRIKIAYGDDHVQNILMHFPRVKRIRLLFHYVDGRTRFDPILLSKLDYFSLLCRRGGHLRRDLSEVDLPYKFFYAVSLRKIHFCLGNDVNSVRKKYHPSSEDVIFVKGFSTRFVL